MEEESLRKQLARGGVIPAHPLALNSRRRLDEKRQVALTRYYLDAGVCAVAVGVHTTQFEIRKPGVDLLEPVLSLAAETAREWADRLVVLIAGLCGDTRQACREAALARSKGYHVGLLALRAGGNATVPELIEHAKTVAREIPLMGFYLQEKVGGRVLPYRFWREFFEIPEVVGVKVAPFDRYRTLDVLRALSDSARGDIALYTGNDDSIVADLLTPFPFRTPEGKCLRFAGGLLGQWAVWTRRAVEVVDRIKSKSGTAAELLSLGAALTDANAAIFDAKGNFAGCIPGIHEVLRRQGLLQGRWCIDPTLDLSPGQMEEIDRIFNAYPYLRDDEFVQANLSRWLD